MTSSSLSLLTLLCLCYVVREQVKGKLKGKQEMCVTQLEDNTQKMQSLGTLPHGQHEQYKASGCATGWFDYTSFVFRVPPFWTDVQGDCAFVLAVDVCVPVR